MPCTSGDCYDNAWWLRLHGSLMYIGWMLVLPWGALIALYRRHYGKAGGGELHKGTYMQSQPSFYPIHRNLQMIGVALVFLGFIAGYVGVKQVWDSDDAHWFEVTSCTTNQFCSNKHTTLGGAIVILMLVQVLLGVYSHKIKAAFDAKVEPQNTPWTRPLLPSYLHVYLGHALCILSIVNCALGLDLYDFIYDSTSARAMVWVTLIVGLGGYTSIGLYEQYQLNSARDSHVPGVLKAPLLPPRSSS